jgi:hypothetical protein
MTAEQRKAKSESLLRTLAVPVNKHLPPIEADEQVHLRSEEELAQRLVALWAVVGTAVLPGDAQFRDYIASNGLQAWLSSQERDFMLAERTDERDRVKFSWQLEALYFVAWSAGLFDSIGLPERESDVRHILHLFPRPGENLDKLRSAIRPRAKEEVLDWADLLYRLHWTVRDAQLSGNALPPRLKGGVIQEWHRAVNWLICYGGEDDWDHVATDT